MTRTALVVGLLLGGSQRVHAQPADVSPRHVLPPDAGPPVGRWMESVELPENCAWFGARIDRDRVLSRYACGAGDAGTEPVGFELVLVHPETSPDSPHSEFFAVLEPTDAPQTHRLIEAVLEALRASERDVWILVVQEQESDEGDIDAGTWGHRIWAVGVGALLFLLGGIALVRRRARLAPPEVNEQDLSLRPLVIALGIVWLVNLAVALSSFRFAMDDFTYLVAAGRDPWAFDPTLRLIGVRVPFYLAAGSRSVVPFAAFNALAFVAICALAATLARSLGATKNESRIAGLLIGLAPGFIELLRFAAGFQQLLALALILLSLLAFDRVSERHRATPRRLAWLAVGVGSALLAVFTKCPVAVLIPVLGLLFAARSSKSARGLSVRGLGFLGLGGVMLLSLSLEDIAFVSGAGGTGRLGENASGLFQHGGDLLIDGALAVAVVATARLGAPFEGFGAQLAATFTARSGRFLLAALLGAAALFSSIPFLFNATYFAAYYAVFPAVWISILIARALRQTHKRALRRPLVGAIVIAAIFLPYAALRATTTSIPFNDIDDFLEEVEAAGAPEEPREIGLVAECGSDEETARSRATLERYYELTEDGAGIRWVLSLEPMLPVVLNRDAPATLLFCETGSPRLRWR